jgi:transcription antitermination factor NusB
MGRRRRARELAVQVLFHMEFSPGEAEEVFQLISTNFGSPESIKAFSRLLVAGVCEHREDLDRFISQASEHWRLERMSLVDRNVLRLGLYELLHVRDIPAKVSIDEAVELGKRFGNEESGAFINGVLDAIHRRLVKEGALEAKDEEVSFSRDLHDGNPPHEK